MTDTQPVIRVSAVVLRDERGRFLTVRKRGTSMFMFPGGKPEHGESPAQTAIRELDEELGVTLEEDRLELIGTFSAPAANEPDHVVES
ncbi:MAG: NUDIX domain-containing protein, partial [Luteococcus japonicus]